MTHTNISIFQKGETSNPSIIFVHGFPYDHSMWDEVTDNLCLQFNCVTYDIRGLGTTDPGDGQFTMEMFSDDLFNVMEKQNLEQPVLCGLSMGGYIALRAIEKSQKKFRALILLDTKSEADNNQTKLKRAQGISVINSKGLNAFLKEFIPSCFAEESIERLGEKYENIFQRSSEYSPVGVKGCILAMAGRTDTTEYLSKINIPTVVICGEKDKLSPPESMEKLASQIKGSSFVKIKNSGHMTPVEQPEEVIKTVRHFLGSL